MSHSKSITMSNAKGDTQILAESEGVRRRILEQAGWHIVEQSGDADTATTEPAAEEEVGAPEGKQAKAGKRGR